MHFIYLKAPHGGLLHWVICQQLCTHHRCNVYNDKLAFVFIVVFNVPKTLYTHLDALLQ